MKADFLFFDFDGTLVDSKKTLFDAYENFAKEFNFPPSVEEFERLNGPALPEIVEILKKTHKLPQQFESLYQAYNQKIETYYQQSNAFDDAEDILESLNNRKIHMALVTSSLESNCLPILERLNWTKYFKFIIFGNQVKFSKPNPEIYHLAWKKSAEENKKNIIVIEDSKNGVISATQAGLFVIGCYDENLKKHGAQMSIHKLSELNGILS